MSRGPCLVTGGAGFIGSALVDLLVRSGWTVRVLDDLSAGRRENLPAQGCELVEGDVCDPGAVERATAGVSVVFHLAAVPSVGPVHEWPFFGWPQVWHTFHVRFSPGLGSSVWSRDSSPRIIRAYRSFAWFPASLAVSAEPERL